MSYGVDLGNSTIKVVALQRRLRGFVVTGAARRRLPKLAKPEDRKPAMQKLLHDSMAGMDGRRAGIVGLSGRDINLQVVQQPQMKRVNYRVMMGYEVDQRKGTDGQLYGDYCTLREPDAYFHQFLAMVGVGRMSYVDERIEIAKGSGIDVRDAVPNSFALYAAHKNAYGAEGGTVLLLDLGAENMDMALIRGGKLIYARNVSSGARLFDGNIGGMANTTPEEGEWLKIRYGNLLPASDNADPQEEEIRPAIRTAAGQISGFLQASVNHAKRELGDAELAVDKVYLSGGGARLRGLPEYLQSSLKIPLEPFDPFRSLDTSAVEKMGVDEFRSLPTDMAVAVGLAELALMPTERSTLSILPDAIKKRRNFFRTSFYLGGGAATLLAALLILTVVGMIRRGDRRSKLEKFTQAAGGQIEKIERMRQIEGAQRDVLAKLDKLTSATLAPKAIMDVVSEIRQYEEEGVMIRELRIVDPNEESERQGKASRRCLFHHAELGLVLGEIEERTEETLKVRPDFPASSESRVFPVVECSHLATWEAEVRVVIVVGEVSAELPGKANRVLDEIKRRLTKEKRGQVARTASISDSDRAGWRRFEIAVFCQVRYE